jgi:acyl-[acyl-carrier-protein]-phospholipid O-acyltransferase/long-chain-fatty-acid--[acyl-carrier-protein] ligase
MTPPLMLSRRFAPLFWCQFFAAFNDNFLKTALVFLILFRSGAADTEALITLASAIFIAPYFFLSALGGELADRHDKARMAQWLKFVEIFVAALAMLGFALQSVPILFGALAGFGVIAALFGPIKYGILPDHLARAELPAGNALVEGATFVAILTGTIVGGLAARGGGDVAAFAALVMGFALACWLSSLLIPPTGEGAPRLKVSVNIAASTAAMIRHLRADARLWWGAMVTSWFWLVGIVVLSLLPPLIKTLIGGNEDTVTAFLALFTIAVGAGSGLAAAIARGRIVLNTTLAGAVLLGAFALDLGIATFGAAPALSPQAPGVVFSSELGIRVAVDLAGLAISGGLFIVPAFAAVQAWAGADYRARTVAAVNVLNAAFMTGATVAVAVMQKYGVTVPVLFAMIGVATFFVAAAIWRTMPKAD